MVLTLAEGGPLATSNVHVCARPDVTIVFLLAALGLTGSELDVEPMF